MLDRSHLLSWLPNFLRPPDLTNPYVQIAAEKSIKEYSQIWEAKSSNVHPHAKKVHPCLIWQENSSLCNIWSLKTRNLIFKLQNTKCPEFSIIVHLYSRPILRIHKQQPATIRSTEFFSKAPEVLQKLGFHGPAVSAILLIFLCQLTKRISSKLRFEDGKPFVDRNTQIKHVYNNSPAGLG